MSKLPQHRAIRNPDRARTAGWRVRHGYTLIEVLVVVVILGICGAMVIPSMGSTNVLKVQGALRQIVSDITFAQSDAVAFQEKRAVCFDTGTSSYSVVQIPGSAIDLAANTMYDPTRSGGKWLVHFPSDPRMGDARIVSADFGSGSKNVIFDGLGGLIADPGSNNPGPGGTVKVTGSGSSWTITVEPFTGRVTVGQDP